MLGGQVSEVSCFSSDLGFEDPRDFLQAVWHCDMSIEELALECKDD